ncbi:dihydroxyacetone kinase 1 [Coprinopsis sp. MPI-PUGE-AT-0042]|nr:dihydroxyacetone kinase 1 [Coprinopsis sp. MPI-PUGE-AT-0042]
MSIQSKHLLNSPDNLVLESLSGLCDVNPQLGLDVDNKIVFLREQNKSKVTLVCGGGSGHEPAHASYVGQGMLTAAVCGSVFASPNASQVRRGIDIVDSEKGTIIIVKNYTGDILNFGLAKEQYAASHPEKAENVRFVIVGDDVAVGKTQGHIVGRRGLAGTVLVYKIAGALAEAGAQLDEVHGIAEWVANNVVTIGASLGHVHVPGTAALQSNLSTDELEIGMGIHNEAGNSKESPLPSLSGLITKLLEYLTSKTDPERSFLSFQKGDEVVLMVNNLGGVSPLELTGIVAEARKQLVSRGFKLARILCGTYMTSLNMPGFSLTLLLLPKSGSPWSREKILSMIDFRPDAPGWPWSSVTPPSDPASRDIKGTKTEVSHDSIVQLKSANPTSFVTAMKNAAKSLIDAEPDITRMDMIAGDGDCGLTLKAGAQAVIGKIDNGAIDGNNIVSSLVAIAQVAEEAMGGTSGALYSIFFSGLAQGFQSQAISSGSVVTDEQWKTALSLAKKKLYSYTRARPPSRTLVDPLAAFIDGIDQQGSSFADAVKEAARQAENTKNLQAKAGRSAYVEGDTLNKEQIPDPGAWGVKTILDNLGL